MNEPLDMSRFIEAKSDQLNADDLIGRSLTVKVTKVAGADGDQPVAIHYEGDNGKPFKPCKTIRRVLVAIWGRYAADYVGRSMTLYRDDTVQFGGLQVGGIRISHMSHLDKETIVVVAKSKGKKAGMKILPLANAPTPTADLTPAEAEALLRNALTLDDLRTVWSKKAVAPHRTALQGVLDECKAALSFDAPRENTITADSPNAEEGPGDSERGEAFAGEGVEG